LTRFCAKKGAMSHAGESLRTIRTDQVGSLPRPRWLAEKQAQFDAGTIGPEELETVHRKAVSYLLERQEQIGFPILSDGEVTRRGFQESFGGAVSGFDSLPHRYSMDSGYPEPMPGGVDSSAPPSLRVPSGTSDNGPAISRRRPTTDRLRLVRNVILEEYLRSSSLASTPVKVTLVGPDRISQRFAHETSRAVYGDMDEFIADVVAIEIQMIGEVVAAGCSYIQIDEPGYTAYVDAPSLAVMRGRGEDPAMNLARGIAADNALRAPFPEVTFAIHICRGGGGGRGGPGFHREGYYDAIAEQLYNELSFDRFLLEYDSEASGSFESLRYLPNCKIAVLGLVSNHGEVETKDYIKRRLDEATNYFPVSQAALCPRCGFHAELDEEAVWGKLALLQEVASEVWF
jgi:5-methyltetrahydropteroyltriglutamate--homocysteine methyltransferase